MGKRYLKMALTDKEREELKDGGYIYHRSLKKWMTPAEIEKHNEQQEFAGNLETIGAAILVGIIFIYMFTLF
jgi:hypothetical protein